MDLLKYLKSKFPGSSSSVESKERLHADWLQFKKTYRFGFPAHPSCLAFDGHLGLIAIGTATGLLNIYGRPGVEFRLDTQNQLAFLNLFFLPKQAQLVAYCEDQSFHLFELNTRGSSISVDHTKNCSTVGKLKQISACCLGEYNGVWCIFVGTESGNVYSLNTGTFEIIDRIIYQEAIGPNIPDDFKLNPGAVEALSVHPSDRNKLLLGFNRGLIIHWNVSKGSVMQTFVAPLKVESLCWHDVEERFYSSHSDGSYITWNLADSASSLSMDVRSPFGPFPCKSINKIVSRTSQSKHGDFLMFTGGMPRAAYSDRNALAVQTSEKEVVFDFTNQILDFVVYSSLKDSELGEPEALLVLCDEELVAIDLVSDGWPSWRLPYLHSFHASAVTACFYLTDVPQSTFSRLLAAGSRKSANGQQFSEREWPIQGGLCLSEKLPYIDLMITGHEDGSVKFWHGSCPAYPMLYSINSAMLFEGYVNWTDNSGEGVEEWPPFRRVGCYDPFTDDARFTVHRIYLDNSGSLLVVGGAAGQLSLWSLCDETVECGVKVVNISLVENSEHFEWKGHDALKLRGESILFEPGFRLASLLQSYPPASISSAALNANWGLVAFGTAHGFAVFDFKNSQVVLQRSMLLPSDVTPAVTVSETTISRYKSFKKSLRESFRRKRKPRQECSNERRTSGVSNSASPQRHRVCNENFEPVERAVEARSEAKQLTSLVRFISFAHVNLVTNVPLSPSLWVGTNGGVVVAYLLKVPDDESRRDGTVVSCVLAKEIRLRHGAPVIGIYFLEQAKGSGSDHGESQRIIVCTEEQIKSFSLPSLKPLRQKYRLTALEGSRVVKTQMSLMDTADGQLRFLLILTNLGVVAVFDTCTVKPVLSAQCIPSYFITGVLSAMLTTRGEGFFLLNSSEWQRFTVSANTWVQFECSLDLPDIERLDVSTNADAVVQEISDMLTPEGLSNFRKLNVSSPTGQNVSGDSVTDYVSRSSTSAEGKDVEAQLVD